MNIQLHYVPSVVCFILVFCEKSFFFLHGTACLMDGFVLKSNLWKGIRRENMSESWSKFVLQIDLLYIQL